MCGILGSINIPFGNETLDLIKHRGPDSGNIENYLLGDSTVRLGHRRLSIVDLSPAGNQPMSTKEDAFSIIFNGEIYNHQNLKDTLTEFNFRGHSDTETILNYLAKNGIQKLNDFNGIFALAFLDKKKRKLYLARDPFGVKPLYYYQGDDKFLFSSEQRPLKYLLKNNLQLAKENLAELLKLRYLPSPHTLYANIKKLYPGHILEYDLEAHSITILPYIKPVAINRNHSFNKALDKYGELFEKSVKRQLMSDVDVGVLLSGGIDSALVTYFAQKHYPGKLKSFTVGFEEKDESNEISEAKETADLLGTEHHEVVISGADFEESIEKIISIVEEPLGTTSSIPMFYLNQEVSKHLKVVLTGQGADEPLGGYTRYKGEVYRKRFPPFLFSLLSPIAGKIKDEKIARTLKALGDNDRLSRFEKTYALFYDNEIKKLMNYQDTGSKESIRYFYDLLNCNEKNGAEAMMAIDARMNLADDLLLYTDKISMHFGLETRVPILDTELVEFIETLPLEYRIKNGKGKYIHKEFAKAVLPEKIVNRPKKGFQSPTQKWFQEKLGDFFTEKINGDESEFSKVFDKKVIFEILQKHKNGFNKEKQLFTLLSLYYWFQKD